jgi:hypothetical protein
LGASSVVWLILFEMAHTESEVGHDYLEKRLDRLKMQVNRINCFLKHEKLENRHTKPGIFPSTELPFNLGSPIESSSHAHVSPNGTHRIHYAPP